MRTATVTLVAVLTAMAVSGRAYGRAPAGAEGALSYPDAPHRGWSSAPLVIAGDSAGDPIAGEALGGGLPASGTTAEIPSDQSQSDPPETSASPDAAASGEQTSSADASHDPQQTEDAGQSEAPPHVYSLQDFVNQGLDESPLGMELREDCSRLKTREKVCGLAVLDIRSGSPAARAGIQRYTALTHDLLDGASVAAALVFPPAIVAVAVIDSSGIGESFDLVIGVDGRRVRHVLDFQDFTANIRPGDVVYLTIVRDGKRMQVPVHVPSGGLTAQN
jgi:S1-C subfamily serine protease